MRIRVALVAMALFFVSAPTAVAEPVWAPVGDDVREKLKTDCDQAWFWSGRTNNQSVRDYAEKAAAANDGFTLAAKLKQQNIPEPDPHDDELWQTYSKYFAEGSRCQVWAVLGTSVRPESVWNKVEYPTLQANSDVTYVWSVNSLTDLACVKWKQPELPEKKCYKIKT